MAPVAVVIAAVAAFDAADLAVAAVSAQAGHDALAAIGLSTAITFSGVAFGGLRITRLTLVGDGKLNMVDLITPRSERYAQALMHRPLRGALDGQELRVVAPEDFVLLKVLSTRDRDLEDARTIVAALGVRLDRVLMDREAALLATELPDHDVDGRYRAVMAA